MGLLSSIGDAVGSVVKKAVDVAEDVGGAVLDSAKGAAKGALQMAQGDFQGGLTTLATSGPAGQVVGLIGGDDAQHKFGAVLGGAANVAFQTGVGFATGGPAGAATGALTVVMNDGLIDMEAFNKISGSPEYQDGLAQFQQEYDTAAQQYAPPLQPQAPMQAAVFSPMMATDALQQQAFVPLSNDVFCSSDVSQPVDLGDSGGMSTHEFC